MIAIKNATLVMRDHLIPDAVLFIENEIITGFGEMRNTPIPEGCEIIDAEGLFVGPVWWISTTMPVAATGSTTSPLKPPSLT